MNEDSWEIRFLKERESKEEAQKVIEKLNRELEKKIKERIEKKVLEQAIRDSREKFRGLADSAQDSIIMVDEGDRILYWNNSAKEMFGYKREEVFKKELHKVIVPFLYRNYYMDGFNEFKLSIHNRDRTKKKIVSIFGMRREGEQFPIEATVSTLYIKNRLNIVWIIRDVSKRAELEAKLKLLNFNLEQKVKEEVEKNQKKERETQHLKNEMEIAKTIQNHILPKKLPQSENLEISTFYVAAEYVAGDYYDFFLTENGDINIIIADVSGHGIGSGMLVSNFRGLCRALLSTNENLEKQLKIINNNITKDSGDSGVFITAFFIRYFVKENSFIYVSAGHNDILYFNSELNSIEKLKSQTLPLGVIENINYNPISKTISKDDLILLYTDGLSEANNKNSEMFGLDRVEKILNKHSNNPPKEIINNLNKSLNEFIGRVKIDDDMTILITKFI